MPFVCNRALPTKGTELEELGAFSAERQIGMGFELTEETGPDVLLVWGGLLDVVSFVPTNREARDRVFLRSIGEATLVIELRDSESGATLARLLDRRALDQASSRPTRHTTGAAVSEVRRLARRWARRLRESLDDAPTLLRIESAGESGRQQFSNIRKPNIVQNEIYRQVEGLEDRRLQRLGRAAAGGAAAAPVEVSIPEQIEKLDQLRRQGVVTEEEFQTKKRELLDRM